MSDGVEENVKKFVKYQVVRRKESRWDGDCIFLFNLRVRVFSTRAGATCCLSPVRSKSCRHRGRKSRRSSACPPSYFHKGGRHSRRTWLGMEKKKRCEGV